MEHDNLPESPLSPGRRRFSRLLRITSLVAVLAVIACLGTHQMQRKLAVVKPIQFVGHADEAAYALMGESFSQGRGLEVDYISWFFIPYSPEVTRREDHWPPFMGLSMAPCFYFLGHAAWVAKLPAIFFGSVGLPLTTALLAYALSRRGYVALIAALLMMAHPLIYAESLKTLSDISTAMLLAGFCGCLLLTREHPWMHLPAGAFLAAAYFAKGAELILLPLYPLAAVMICGRAALCRRWLYLGLATALLLIAPYWFGNWRAYGNPLHSTQNYVSGFYGLDDWELKAYYPYWGHDLPKTSDRWTVYGDRYWEIVREKREQAARYMLTGMATAQDPWEDFGEPGRWMRNFLRSRANPPGSNPPTNMPRPLGQWAYLPGEMPALLAAALVVLLALICPVQWFIRRRAATPDAPAADPLTLRSLAAPTAVLLLILVTHAAFLVYLWGILPRFCFLFLPLLAALGCTAGAFLLEGSWRVLMMPIHAWFRRQAASRPRWQTRGAWAASSAPMLLNLLLAAVLLGRAASWNATLDRWIEPRLVRDRYPFRDDTRYPRLGQWLSEHLPQTVVMCRNPWELRFAAGRNIKTVNLPNPRGADAAAAQAIFDIARHYRVTHLYVDIVRPCMEPYLDGKQPGLKPVPDAPGPLYEIDWSRIHPKME